VGQGAERFVPEREGLEDLRRALVVRPADAAEEARRWIPTGFEAVDTLLGGGFLRGRISEVIGPPSSGRTALLLATVATSSGRGEVAAWIDPASALDVRAAAQAGVALPRLLWVRPGSAREALMAADLVLGAGGFALVVVDLGEERAARFPDSAWARLARAAERSGAAVAVLAQRRPCGTFAAVTLDLAPLSRRWSGLSPARAVLFDVQARARIARSKIGAPGRAAVVRFRGLP
jgi:hypothetical protein